MQSAASRLLEHQLKTGPREPKPAMNPKEREFNKLKTLLDRIDYHHHQLNQGAPGSSDDVAGLVVAFGAPKSQSGRSRSSRGLNAPPAQQFDPPTSSFELLLRDHHKLCESPPARSPTRAARLETLRQNLETLDDDDKPPQSTSHHPSSQKHLRTTPYARQDPKPSLLSPTTTDDWDLLMQVRAAMLGGDTSPIFGSESERIVFWPSK